MTRGLFTPQFVLRFYNGINDHSFIAEEKFLVLECRGTMEIYCVADKSKPPQCTAKFSLPSLMDHVPCTRAVTGINIIPTSMLPYSQKSYQPTCSIHPNTNDQLVAIHVSVTGTMGLTRPIDSRCYSFFMLRSVIVELENLFAETYGQPTLNDPKLLWSTWGPQHTSWFRVQRDEDWRSSLCGFRVVEPFNDSSRVSRMPQRLRIRISTHIARNYHAEDKSGWLGQFVEGELTSTISCLFMEPLGSALPYREIVSEELFNVDNILMDESRIMLFKVSCN